MKSESIEEITSWLESAIQKLIRDIKSDSGQIDYYSLNNITHQLSRIIKVPRDPNLLNSLDEYDQFWRDKASKKADLNRKRYQEKKEAREKKSLEIFKDLKVGDFINVYGTSDNEGVRKIEMIDDNTIICKQYQWSHRKAAYVWTGRTTTHMNTKIVRIIPKGKFNFED